MLAKAGMSLQIEREDRIDPGDWPVKPTGDLPISFQTGTLHTHSGPHWAEIQSNGEWTRFTVNVAGRDAQSTGEVSWSEKMRELVTWQLPARRTKSVDEVLALIDKVRNALQPVMLSEDQES
jgi:hypothetical protein